MLLINLDKNKGKILEYIKEKYEKIFKKKLKKNQQLIEWNIYLIWMFLLKLL